MRLVLGSLYGKGSPVKTFIEMMPRSLPARGYRFGEAQLLVLRPGAPITITIAAVSPARLVLLGPGRRWPLASGRVDDGSRRIWWNFVSSSKERID